MTSSSSGSALFQKAGGVVASVIVCKAADPKKLHRRKVLTAFPSFLRWAIVRSVGIEKLGKGVSGEAD
jgi:hypothetical protein